MELTWAQNNLQSSKDTQSQCTICQNKKKIQTFWNETSKWVGSADGHQMTFLFKRLTKQILFYSCYMDDC
jgi:hypothetical protein